MTRGFIYPNLHASVRVLKMINNNFRFEEEDDDCCCEEDCDCEDCCEDE
jgi:hypothetical protein